MNIVDGGPGQEDPDSMGQLLVQKKNVLFEADGKEAATGLPSPISSKVFVFASYRFLHARMLRNLLHQHLRERDTPISKP